MTKNPAALALLSLRKKVKVKCALCGKITERLSSAKYCSSRCSNIVRQRRKYSKIKAAKKES